MKKQVMRTRGFKMLDYLYKHLEKKAGKHGTPSAALRDIIETDMKRKQGERK